MCGSGQTTSLVDTRLRSPQIQHTLQGANRGRTHASVAAGSPDASRAPRSRESAVPRPTVPFLRGALRKKHCAMEVVLADGMH
jgi:hypothetical protein